MFKLNENFDADSLLHWLSHFQCDGHTVHTLTHWCPPPPLTSTVKLSLFTHAHSSPLSLAARLHWCYASCSCHINNGWTFSRQISYVWEKMWTKKGYNNKRNHKCMSLSWNLLFYCFPTVIQIFWVFNVLLFELVKDIFESVPWYSPKLNSSVSNHCLFTRIYLAPLRNEKLRTNSVIIPQPPDDSILRGYKCCRRASCHHFWTKHMGM